MALKVVAQVLAQRAMKLTDNDYYVYGNPQIGWFLADYKWFAEVKKLIVDKFNPLMVEQYDKESGKWISAEKY